MTEKETLPEQALGPDPGRVDPHEVLALVVLWSADEPWRIGQVLLLPTGEPDSVVVFGRGASSGAERRVSLVENRPGRITPTPPLGSAAISRRQLEIRVLGSERVMARNIGRCPLLRKGQPVEHRHFEVGEILQLGRQMLLLVSRRSMASTADGYPDFPFGEPDTHGIVGESESTWRLRAQIARVARQSGHVLISGPTGSGKELVAQAIHSLSPRSHRNLISRSAATLPDSLVDAELFGNSRNYPNPGMRERPGLVGEANGTTLFLDELGELAVGPQAHLLRVLDRGEYSRLGEAVPRRSDLRLVAATNREPSALKEDLLARFKIRICVPDLSARVEDIPLIVRHLIRRAAAHGDSSVRKYFPDGDIRVEPRVGLRLMRELLERPLEANVRELESTLSTELTAPELRTSLAPDPSARRSTSAYPTIPTSTVASSAGENNDLAPEHVQRCLDENNGILELTWRALGLRNRFALVRIIKKYQLQIRRRPGQGPLRTSKRSRED